MSRPNPTPLCVKPVAMPSFFIPVEWDDRLIDHHHNACYKSKHEAKCDVEDFQGGCETTAQTAY